MAYRKGDVELLFKAEYLDDDQEPDEFEKRLYDSRADEDRYFPLVRLPHSCDSWVIGGLEEIETMIADLQEAHAKLKAHRE